MDRIMLAGRSFTENVQRFLESLNSHHVDYVVCGGVACLFHGVNRTTGDLDISVDLDDANLRRFIAVAKEFGLQPRIPEPIENLGDRDRRQDWIMRKNAMVYTLTSPGTTFQVDVFLHHSIPHDELRASAVRIPLGSSLCPVSSKENLIRAKLSVSPPRKQDLRDIEDLRELIERERKT